MSHESSICTSPAYEDCETPIIIYDKQYKYQLCIYFLYIIFSLYMQVAERRRVGLIRTSTVQWHHGTLPEDDEEDYDNDDVDNDDIHIDYDYDNYNEEGDGDNISENDDDLEEKEI